MLQDRNTDRTLDDPSIGALQASKNQRTSFSGGCYLAKVVYLALRRARRGCHQREEY